MEIVLLHHSLALVTQTGIFGDGKGAVVKELLASCMRGGTAGRNHRQRIICRACGDPRNRPVMGGYGNRRDGGGRAIMVPRRAKWLNGIAR